MPIENKETTINFHCYGVSVAMKWKWNANKPNKFPCEEPQFFSIAKHSIPRTHTRFFHMNWIIFDYDYLLPIYCKKKMRFENSVGRKMWGRYGIAHLNLNNTERKSKFVMSFDTVINFFVWEKRSFRKKNEKNANRSRNSFENNNNIKFIKMHIFCTRFDLELVLIR